jgi:hypothetical protein
MIDDYENIWYNVVISYKNTNMITDVTLMGPHALASYRSRMLALEQFWVTPHALVLNEETRALAKFSKTKRELALQWEHDIVSL